MGADGPRYRLVVSDIDGTLLDSASVLRPRVQAAIAAARQEGIIVTVATGRRFSTTQPLLRELGFAADGVTDGHQSPGNQGGPGRTPPVVLQTGAVVVSADGADVLHRDPVPREDALRAIDIIVGLGLQPIVYENRVVGQRLYSGPAAHDSPGAHTYLESNADQVVRRPYDQLILDGDPLQIAVIGDREPLRVATARLSLAHCRTIISYSLNLDSYFMEVFHRHCDKWRGVEHVARHLGITRDQTVCIGYNWNDVEMLALAGCGVAVANAAPGVEPYARRRCPSNDQDAVATILDQILAGEEPGHLNPAYDPTLRD